MNSSREAIYGGLFALLVTAVDGMNFITISRRTKLWADVPPEQQPALFMKQLKEDTAVQGKTPGPPNCFVLWVDVIIYAYQNIDACGGASVDPFLNNCVDKISALFAPGKKLGLQGVLEARVWGEIVYGEGLLSGQGVAVVPIRIVAV